MTPQDNGLEQALVQVAEALDRLAQGALDTRLTPESGSPLAERLAAAFNRLATRLQEDAAATPQPARARTLPDDHEIIFNAAPIAIWYKDTHNRILRLNPAAAAAMGRTVEEVEGRSAFDLHSREEAEGFYRDDLEVINARAPKLGIVEELRTPAGESNWIRTDKVPYFDAAGNVVGIVVLSQDITAQKRAEEALRRAHVELERQIEERTAALIEERNRLRTLIDHLPDIVYVKDREGRFVLINDIHARLLGELSPEAAVGKTDFDYYPREMAEAFFADDQRVVRFGEPVTREEPGRDAQGKPLWVLTTKAPLRDASGRVIGLVGIGRDITERRRAEMERERLLAEMQRNAELLRSLIDATPDWIFVKDQNFRYTLANKGYADALHLRPEDLIGKDDLDLGFPEELVFGNPDKGIRGFRTDDVAVLQRGEALVNPYDPATVDGELRVLHTFKTPLRDADGNIVGVLGLARDISERQQLLDTLQRRSIQLQTAVEVSEVVNSILDLNTLQQQVVNLIRDRFNLYYVGLFVVDQSGEWTGEPGRWAVLRAGTGDAGRLMLERGHKLEVGGASMIGWCTANRQARIALDVGEEAVRFDNPLLPGTRSELALPLMARGQIIGALSIQSEQEAAFSDEDIAALQTMTNQIANALENARLFEETRRRAASEEMVNRVAMQLQGQTDMEAMLYAAMRELGRALDARRARVRLHVRDEDDGRAQ